MDDKKKAKEHLIAELTELRKWNANLNAKEFTQKIIDCSLDMIVTVKKDQNIVEFNNAASETFGYSKEEIIGKHVNILYADDEEGRRVSSQVLKNGIYKGEIQNVRKNGEVFTSFLSAAVLRDENGNVIGTVGNSRDITERKQTEETETQYIKRMEFLTKNAMDFADFSSDDNIYQAIGNKLKEITGDSIVSISSFDEKNNQLENRVIFGIERKIETILKIWGKHPVGMIYSLNEEEKGELTNGKLVNIEGGLYALTFGQMPRNVCKTLESMFGIGKIYGAGFVSKGKLYGASTIITFKGSKPIDTELVETFLNQTSVALQRWLAERTLQRAYNELEKRVQERTAELKKANEELRIEITERKKAEETLQESEEKYRTLTEGLRDVVVSFSLDGRIDYCSPVVKEFGGYNPEEEVGSHLSKYIADEAELQKLQGLFQQIIDTKKPVTFEFLYKPKNKKPFYVETTANPVIRGNKVETIQCVVRDITERKQLEEERIKTEKLESIGILAGGIAHDFNNILAIILGNTSLAKMNLDNISTAEELLTEVEKASLRAKDLTQQLLTFSKGGAPVKEKTELTEFIRNIAEFSLSGSNVNYRISIAPDLWVADVDKGQINQAFNNLIINARQAMPEGGTINIAAENITITSEDNLPPQDGNYIKVTLKDRGTGIPEEHLTKIFDPYFTTKKQGSGLGLATSYSIIKRHGGYITVESELGIGTTFHIYLPASSKQVEKKEAVKEEPAIFKGKILLMDDEPAIRKIVSKTLTRGGSEVEVASDGTEAIKLYKKAMDSGKPFDVVIMDLTIPGGMGGKETIKKLLEIDSEVKAVISSGYADDPVVSNYKEYGFKRSISKPWKFEDLIKVINEVYDYK